LRQVPKAKNIYAHQPTIKGKEYKTLNLVGETPTTRKNISGFCERFYNLVRYKILAIQTM
jgi:hypothetical protein